MPDDKADEARQLVAGGNRTTARKPGQASEKQLTAISKLLRRVEHIHQFDSFGGSGQELAEQIREQIRKWGGRENLTSKQASDLISQLMGAVDDEM